MQRLSYDAVFVLAYGFRELVTSGISITGPNLYRSLIGNISFIGATGSVGLFLGYPKLDYYGQGERTIGHQYRMMNFQQKLYEKSVNDSFALVSLWNDQDGLTSCSGIAGCSPVETTSPNNALSNG